MSALVKSINYDELMSFFSSFKSGFIIIGGKWCENCNAVHEIVENEAIRFGVDTIYEYDPVFKNIYGEQEDLRDCKSLEIKLKYYAIVERSGFKSKELVKDTLIPKIHVPFFMAIKNGSCVGYYTIELVRDGEILHKENEVKDRTYEFVEKIDELFDKLKENDNRYGI